MECRVRKVMVLRITIDVVKNAMPAALLRHHLTAIAAWVP